ncbi:protein CYPRO4 [Selaginella moellendorffii]|uniref:protein CYPRO4 n=1 Tax=Selaginella moellendorffii TaxID=88036 RepID=UPI000D1C9728|nr:protein CYPRO4 [Selaginella moellendorffii]|eukprot:XP_002989333.2 protein CYPRO4 [Selaginella moellendorffii]
MGASESREGRLDDSEAEEEEEENSSSSQGSYHSARSDKEKTGPRTPLRPPQPGSQKVKLYHYISAKTKWVVAEKLVPWEFMRESEFQEGSEVDDDEYMDEAEGSGHFDHWLLCVGTRIRAKVDQRLQMKFYSDQQRVDFVFQGVWAMRFPSQEDYKDFTTEYHNCVFENSYQLEATEENKVKVFGKDFIGWVKPQDADESIWEDAEETLEQGQVKDLKQTYIDELNEGIRSLALGAKDNSFLVSDSRVEAFRNTPTGLQGKKASVRLGGSSSDSFSTPKKAMLIRGEANMMLLSPAKDGKNHSTNVRQLDLESGKTVAEWKFEKDGTPITMRDVTNDSKSAQLDSSLSTFLGLDDNRLCRWDMRDRHGIVQDIASPVLNWNEGHQFARGTNFQCFASTGDGAVVVGSKDGKIRLYGKTSMRQAKTAFPGLGSPITHVDVTYDGHWVLGTTDTYLILMSTLFIDKDGSMKTGFTGRMGSKGHKLATPRLLKLTPVDAFAAGKNQKFHGGHFSWVTEGGREERHLVVSVGNYTVIWDFKRVKQSQHNCYKNAGEGLKSCYCYKIVPKEDNIVDSMFMHDNFVTGKSPEAPLIVATPKHVTSFNI